MSNGPKDFFDLLDEAFDFIDENEEKISSLLGRNKIRLDEGSMPREVQVTDDEVLIVAETKKEFENVKITGKGDSIVIGYNDKEMEALIPEDARVEDSKADLNNGVLSVTIPRGDNDGDS